MNRQEKQLFVANLRGSFERSSAAFLVTVQGVTVDQIQAFRKLLRKDGAKLLVARNTLVRRVTREIDGLQDLTPYLKQQIAIVFAEQDPAATAKAVCGFAREHEKIAVVAGSYERRLMNKAMVEYLGTLPPREVVIAQACGALQSPIAAHIGVLHQLIARLLYVLQQASEKQK